MSNKINKIRCAKPDGSIIDASLGNDTFELIKTVNITADTKFVVIDTDDDGNPFELKHALLFGTSKVSENSKSTSAIQLFLGADPENYPVEDEFNTDFGRTSISAAVPSKASGKTEIRWATGFEVYGVEDAETENRLMLIRGSSYVDADTIKNVPSTAKGICIICIDVYTSNVWFGAGSTIKVYGVRA